MIISRTPYRISFLGGGTDYHDWYQEHGSKVLSTTFNHYCYISCRQLPPFFEHQSRVVWSKVEEVINNQDIEHPSVRAVLQYLGIHHGLEIQHQGDLPARTGLGSSSAFTVGLLNALYALGGAISSKRQLACEAVHVERDVLKENVGVQDQIATAYGGLNIVTIESNGDFHVEPLILPRARKDSFQKHLMLVYTGVSRFASDIAAKQIAAIKDKKTELAEIQKLVDEGINVLTTGDLLDFGRVLHESWCVKQSLSSSISPTFVDSIYSRARDAGAIGGKLLGAGGGGFMLLFVEPEKQQQVMKALTDLLFIPFEFDNAGSQIILNDPHSYAESALERRNYQHLKAEQATGHFDLSQRHERRPSKFPLVIPIKENEIF